MAVRNHPEWWKTCIESAAQKPKTTTIASTNKKPLKLFVVPNFNATDQKKFNPEIAMYFYSTSTSFMCVENLYLHRAFQLARPNAKLPTRKQLADAAKVVCLKNAVILSKLKWIIIYHLNANMFLLPVMRGQVWWTSLLLITWPFAQQNLYLLRPCTLRSKCMMPSGSPRIWLVLWTTSGKMLLALLLTILLQTRKLGKYWTKSTHTAFSRMRCKWPKSLSQRYFCI